MKKAKQLGFGTVLVSRAVRCWDLTAAVPEEHEAALWSEGDRNMRSAALFGHAEAEMWVQVEDQRAADRSCDQKCFYELAAGF